MNGTRYRQGAWAGIVATLFHTVVMVGLRPRLPKVRHRPLPPSTITRNIAARSGIKSAQHDEGLTVATVISHFGFGAAAGALYAPLGERAPGKVVGVGYGVAVWALSYLGWIPALRILPPATAQSAQQNAMMILAHVAWGSVLAVVYDRVRR